MRYSLNEIEALCKRAARGSGLSWGLAEEAAKAARWLVSFGLPGPQMLASLLLLNDRIPASGVAPTSLTGIWSAPLGRMSPINAGAAMSDSAACIRSGKSIVMQNVMQPLLLVPFTGNAALHLSMPIVVKWDDVNVTTDGHSLSINDKPNAITAERTHTLTCATGGDMSMKIPCVYRGEIDQASWTCLSGFASRTYAPATAQSRTSGAGAGLDGND